MDKVLFTPRLPVVERTDSRVLCKLCDISEWDDPEFRRLSGSIMTGDPECVFRHRKLWEFTKVVQALESFSLLHEDTRGLSVAGGSERLLFYLANLVERVVSTDIYGSGPFISNESDARFLEDQKSFAPYAYREDHLKALWMNALELLFPDGLFDFAFCLSSVEHFGGVSQAARAIKEMGRVVRPGGLVCVSTECAINGIPWEEAFSREQLIRLCEESGLPLAQPVDFRLGRASLGSVLDLRKDKLDVQPHINLSFFGSVFTSIMLVFKKEEKTAHSPRLSVQAFDELIESIRPVSERARKEFVFPENHPSFFRRMRRGVSLRVGEWFK